MNLIVGAAYAGMDVSVARLFNNVDAIMMKTFAMFLFFFLALACSSEAGASHTFSVSHPSNFETTLAVIEVRNATRISDHKWVERLTSPSTSLDITVTRPSLLVALWWGDGAGGAGEHTATPNNGFTIIDSFTLDRAIIQCIVATKRVTAGTYNVTWTSDTGEGAQLWLVAVDAPASDGIPILGGHAIAWDPIGSGGADTTTAGIITNPSMGVGSVILAAVAHQEVGLATAPTDSEGNTFEQLGTGHAYTDWPSAGTTLYAAFPKSDPRAVPK